MYVHSLSCSVTNYGNEHFATEWTSSPKALFIQNFFVPRLTIVTEGHYILCLKVSKMLRAY